MRALIKYPRKIMWGFRGGKFTGHATGLEIVLHEGDQEVHLIPLKKDGTPSESCRISMPLEFLPHLRHVLQEDVLKAKDFAERCAG